MTYLKSIPTYKLPNGQTSNDQAEAAVAWLINITDGGAWEPNLTPTAARLIIDKRGQVMDLLMELPAVLEGERK